MAEENERFGVSAELDLSQWEASVAQVLRDAGRMESRLVALAQAFERLTAGGGDVSIALDVDTGDLDSLTGEIESLSDADVSVSVAVEDADFETLSAELTEFDGTAAEASATATADDSEIAPFDELLTEIDETEAEGTASATTSGEDEVSLLDADLAAIDGKDVEANVDVTTPPEGGETINLLKQIRAGVAFTLIMNVAGTILDLFHAIEQFTVAPFLDVDEAAAGVEARTGGAVENVRALIDEIHQADLGENFNQIADVIIEAQQIGIATRDGIEEAATAALNFTKVFKDQNPADVLDTLNQAVELGLVPSITQAGDLLTVAFQTGTNRGGDLLATLRQYGPTFAGMGLDMQQTLSILNSGLDAGFRNTQDAARAFATFQDNIIGGSDDVKAALDEIDLELPDGGQIGADFVADVLAGIQALPEGAGRDEIISKLFGARTGGTEAVLEITPEVAEFENVEGASEEAAAALDDHFRGAFDDLRLELETLAHDFLSSEAIDLPGKLNAIKEGLRRTLEEVAAGTSLGEALEKGLRIEGLSDFIARFESAVGNAEIVFLQVIAAIANLSPSVGAGVVRDQALAEVERLGAQQFTFDLKLQDSGAGITSTIQTAIARGVEPAIIGQNIRTAIDEELAAGDFANAQRIAANVGDTLGEPFAAEMQAVVDHAIASAHFDFEQAFTSGDVATALNIAQGLNDPALIQAAEGLAATFRQNFENAMAAGNQDAALQFATALGDEELIERAQNMNTEVSAATGEMATSIEEDAGRIHEATVGHSITTDLEQVGLAAQTHLPPMIPVFQTVSTEVDLMADRYAAAVAGIEAASLGFDRAAAHVNILTDAIAHLGDDIVIVQTLRAEIQALTQAGSNATQQVQALTSSQSAVGGLAASQAALVASAGGGDVSNSQNNNVNVTINTRSHAESENAGVRVAEQVRGF